MQFCAVVCPLKHPIAAVDFTPSESGAGCDNTSITSFADNINTANNHFKPVRTTAVNIPTDSEESSPSLGRRNSGGRILDAAALWVRTSASGGRGESTVLQSR